MAALEIGDINAALKMCSGDKSSFSDECLAIVYHRLGRDADANAAMARKLASTEGDVAEVNAQTYAQLGKPEGALSWLEKANARP